MKWIKLLNVIDTLIVGITSFGFFGTGIYLFLNDYFLYGFLSYILGFLSWILFEIKQELTQKIKGDEKK
jgi:hypothetical protein